MKVPFTLKRAGVSIMYLVLHDTGEEGTCVSTRVCVCVRDDLSLLGPTWYGRIVLNLRELWYCSY